MARADCVTTIGKQRIASALAVQQVFTHLAIGDGDTAAIVSDLALESEIYRKIYTTIASDNFTCRGEVTFKAKDVGSGDIEINEIGCLDASVGGNLICRHKLANTIIVKGNQQLTVVYGLVVD